MNTSKILTFFGSGSLAAVSLDFLSDNFQIGAVITKAKPKHYKDPAPVELLASKKSLPIYFANNSADLESLFKQSDIPSNCGIIIDYGVLINPKVIDKFLFGIINSHFSLLPEWRGPDPITFSLLSGQNITGVSLMKINNEVDTGSLLAQSDIQIETNDDIQHLNNKLIHLNNNMLGKHINKYLDGELIPFTQKNKLPTYSQKISKINGFIDWNKPASVLEREIRAFRVWPGSYCSLFDIKMIITKAEVSDRLLKPAQIKIELPDKIFVGCRIGSLKLLEVKPSGKNNMSVCAFINGYKSQLAS
jgi:methionyl-tRNA formyltransferase